MFRKHAQRLIHYIETLEAQSGLIRPRTVETAVRWLESIVQGLADVPDITIKPSPKPREPFPYPDPYVPAPPPFPEVMYGVNPVPYRPFPDDQTIPWEFDPQKMREFTDSWKIRISDVNTDAVG